MRKLAGNLQMKRLCDIILALETLEFIKKPFIRRYTYMSSETILKYNSPAENFDWALPVGNGRIGGMIFGIPDNEIIKLNEDSVWSGGPRHRVNPDAKEGLEEVRTLLKE